MPKDLDTELTMFEERALIELSRLEKARNFLSADNNYQALEEFDATVSNLLALVLALQGSARHRLEQLAASD